MLKKQKGYIGLVAILFAVIFILFWFFYLWNTNWLGGKLEIPSVPGNSIPNNSEKAANQNNAGDINGQLNQFRHDVKNLQNTRDQQIFNELK